MVYPVMFETSRLVAREWQADELDGLHRWLGDPKVNRFLTWGSSSLEQSATHLEEIIGAQTKVPRTQFFLALELKSFPGETIGDVGFTWVEPDVAEIGYFLEYAYWGSGYASEAASAIIKFAFELGATRVIATCNVENRASERVMKNCGMECQKSNDPKRLIYEINKRV